MVACDVARDVCVVRVLRTVKYSLEAILFIRLGPSLLRRRLTDAWRRELSAGACLVIPFCTGLSIDADLVLHHNKYVIVGFGSFSTSPRRIMDPVSIIGLVSTYISVIDHIYRGVQLYRDIQIPRKASKDLRFDK